MRISDWSSDVCSSDLKMMQLQRSSVYVNTWRKHEQFDNPQLFSTFLKVLHEGREKGVITDEVDEKYVLDFIMGTMARLLQMQVHRGMKESLTAQANPLFEMLWRAISKKIGRASCRERVCKYV